MTHSDKTAEIFKRRNIFREKYENWVGYEYTANTLLTLELLSTSHCVGGGNTGRQNSCPGLVGTQICVLW